ncbi:MAG: tail fiber domain-containing protein [Bacteroidia bacterium]|nr:tail fiber domain-containing protein [Bacteroidia bacterium]
MNRFVLLIIFYSAFWAYAQERVGIGTALPNFNLEVYVPYPRISSGGAIHTSSVCVAANMPQDGQQGILAYHLSNSALPYTWRIWYSDPDGGYGVGPLNLEIWEYPDQWGGGSCCRSRFRIVTTYPSVNYSSLPVQIDNQNRFIAYGYSNISDASHKIGVRPLESTLQHVRSLNPVIFHWKGTPHAQIGFIAQEVQRIFPEAVRVDTSSSLLAVDYPALISILTRAAQELSKKIEELEKAIQGLGRELSESQN